MHSLFYHSHNQMGRLSDTSESDQVQDRMLFVLSEATCKLRAVITHFYNQKKINNTFWPDLNFEPETSCRCCIVDCDIVSRSDKCLIWVVLCFSSVIAIRCINVFFYTMSEFKSIIIINIHYSIT